MIKFLQSLILMLFVANIGFAQTTLFSDNFESYTTDQKLAEQATGSEWTTWTDSPGSGEDAAITTEQASEGTKSAKIITNNDLILNLGSKTTGRYQVKFQLFVDAEKGAFFGFLQDFDGTNAEFGLSAYFLLDTGVVTVGGKDYEFDYKFDKWMLINVIIDLDDDFATMYLDGNEIASWVWSLGSDGANDISTLYGIDFWGYSDENGCSYYIDEVEYNELGTLNAPTNLTHTATSNNISLSWDAPASGTPTSYSIIRNNSVVASTTNTNYDDNNLYPMNYTYSVRAIYGEQGYSAPTNEVSETIAGGVARELVLIEVGTGTWCPYCPAAAKGIHDMLAENLNIGAVKYHNGDDYVFNDGTLRLNYYGISSFPTSKIDGLLTYGGGSTTASLYDKYKPLYDQRIATPSTHSIEVSMERITDYEFKARMTVSEEFKYFSDDLVLISTITESHIPEAWKDQTEVNNACRVLYPDANGTALDFSSLSAQDVNIDITLDKGWNAENCEFIAFVQHVPTKEIVQAIKFDIGAMVTSMNDTQTEFNNLKVFPNPVKDVLQIEFSLTESDFVKFNVYNEIGQMVKTIDNSKLSAGNHKLELDTRNLNNGLYFIKIESGSESVTKKIQVLK